MSNLIDVKPLSEKDSEKIRNFNILALKNLKDATISIIGLSTLLLEETYGELNADQKDLFEDIKSPAEHLYKLYRELDDDKKNYLKISHEFRTPLNAILGFSDLLLDKTYGPLNEKQIEFLTEIRITADNLLNMVNYILDISKIEDGQLKLNIQRISLNEIINQIVSIIKHACSKKNLSFKVAGIKKEKFINADPIKLKQILLNLLNNAIKFTIKGRITLEILEKENQWEFNITDTGIGIAENDFGIIFEEFMRVNSPYVKITPGFGLGLPLARKLVNLHQGNISFASKLGKGTTFKFTI